MEQLKDWNHSFWYTGTGFYVQEVDIDILRAYVSQITPQNTDFVTGCNHDGKSQSAFRDKTGEMENTKP